MANRAGPQLKAVCTLIGGFLTVELVVYISITMAFTAACYFYELWSHIFKLSYENIWVDRQNTK